MSVCLNSAARETGLRKAGEPHVLFLCLSVWTKQKKSKDVGRWREGLGKLKGMTLAWDVRQYKFLKPGTPAPRSEKRGGEGRFNIVRQTHPQHRRLPGERETVIDGTDRAGESFRIFVWHPGFQIDGQHTPPFLSPLLHRPPCPFPGYACGLLLV